MKIEKLRIALLGVIIALATACGAPAPSNGTIPRDDASITNPETAVAPDAPSPPPDAVSHDDAGSPTPDVVTSVDAAVAPDAPAPTDVTIVDTAPPPPPDSGSGMPPFDPELCYWLRAGQYQVDGSTMTPTGVASCVMQPDGTARVRIGAGFAGAFGCGWDDAICGGSNCYFPRMGETDSCQWSGLSITNLTSGPRRQFVATSPDGTFRVNLFRDPPIR